MPRLRGTGIGAGMALGTAAVVNVQGGVAVAPAPPPRIAALIAQRRMTETPEVVVVAMDYATAVAVGASLAWAKVVGIAAEREAPDVAVPSIPAVTGLSGLMAAAADDTLILVDATRGVALVDPDPIYLAQYTAEHDHVAPKNRFYLDDAHLPALTLDGRAISVVAATGDEGVEAALASGPDALYHALPLTFDADILRRHLASVIGTAAGKPLLIPYNPSLPLGPLVEAAAAADITVCIGPGEDPIIASRDSISAVAAEIERAQAECGDNDILCGAVRLAAEIDIEDESDWPAEPNMKLTIESAAAGGCTRVLLRAPTDVASLPHLMALCAAASINLMPVTFLWHGAHPDPGSDDESAIGREVRLLIGAGVSGLLVVAAVTQRIKAQVRAAGVSEAREELSQLLVSTAGNA